MRDAPASALEPRAKPDPSPARDEQLRARLVSARAAWLRNPCRANAERLARAGREYFKAMGVET